MSDEIRVNRPVQQPAPRMDQGMPMQQMQPASKMPWVILAVVVVVLIVVGVLFREKLFGGRTTTTGETVKGTSTSAYQAVFLTNGQVYFGQLSNPDGNYITLKDIYYLQVGPQQGSADPANPTGAAAQQQSISLVKLGQELHGPVDEMHISRAQVLFYEDLKADGAVVKAITDDKAKQPAQ